MQNDRQLAVHHVNPNDPQSVVEVDIKENRSGTSDSLREYMKGTSHIAATTGSMGGKPRIAGHRFMVSQLLAELTERSLAEISEDYDFELSELVGVLDEVATFFEQRCD